MKKNKTIKRSIEFGFIKTFCEHIFMQLKNEKLTTERLKWELKNVFSFEIEVDVTETTIHVQALINGDYESFLWSEGEQPEH